MSKLDELIAELCPDGVEYKKIKQVYKRLKGTPITAGKMKEIDNPNGEIKIFAGGKTVINAMEKDIPNANITRVPAVLVQSRGVIDAVYYDKPFTFKNEMWAYTADNTIAVKYLYYVLKNNLSYFRKAASGMGSLPQISLPVTEEFVIPVPPLPVQQEIVRILDNFTELTAELKAEIEARKKQYEYYRDWLLSQEGLNKLCPDGVEFVTVGEICDITRGRVLSKDYLRDNFGDYPVYSSQTANNGVFGYINTFDYDCESVTWTTDGANAGSVFYHINEKFSITNVCGLLRVKNNELLSTKFLFYVLQVYAKKYVNDGMGNPKLMSNVMAGISVPLPPLPVQQEIVRILDNFTELIAQLETELEARQKQYEYYRDKLLSFKEATA